MVSTETPNSAAAARSVNRLGIELTDRLVGTGVSEQQFDVPAEGVTGVNVQNAGADRILSLVEPLDRPQARMPAQLVELGAILFQQLKHVHRLLLLEGRRRCGNELFVPERILGRHTRDGEQAVIDVDPQ